MNLNYMLTFITGCAVGAASVAAIEGMRWYVTNRSLWAKKIPILYEHDQSAKFRSIQKPYKLIVAGNYGQFRNWIESYIINVYAPQHLHGRDWDEVEVIKVGDWPTNPVIDLLKECMTEEQWEQFLNDPVY